MSSLLNSWGHVLSRFRLCRCGEKFASGYCPVHEADEHRRHSPSLSVWLGRTGCLLVGCWAGCDKRSILSCVGLKMSDLMKPELPHIKAPPQAKPRRVVEHYVYFGADGSPLYRVCRTEPKGFFQEHWDPKRKGGSWVVGLPPSVPRVLYNLPVIANRPTWPVVVVEGEKDAGRLNDLGLPLVATTNVGGADSGYETVGKWRPEYTLQLAGRRVVVIPDCDRAGMRHAHFVAGALLMGGAWSVRVALLPFEVAGFKGQDVSDWLDLGNGAEELVALIRKAPEWKPVVGAA